MSVHLRQQKRWPYLALENLDQFEFRSTLDLEALQLGQRAVLVKHRVTYERPVTQLLST